MKLNYTDFKGMRPAVDVRVLHRLEATDAVDTDLRYHTLRPFLAPDPATLSGSLRVPLGYDVADPPSSAVNHLLDILHYDTDIDGIPEGLYEVNERGTYVASSAVARDVHERVYFSRPAPDGGVYDRGSTDGTGPVEERPVGVPKPTGEIDPVNVRQRANNEDELAFQTKWFWYVEVAEGYTGDPNGAQPGEIPLDPDTGQPARGSLDDADIEDTTVEGPLGSPAFRYAYLKSNNDPTHVAPTTKWNRDNYHFIMYAELQSQGGRFLGTVYPAPSARKVDTDAYVGGTLADSAMGIGDWPAQDLYEYHDLYYSPASAEYSHYRSYVFTYVTDRGEEGPPSTPTEPVPVLPTEAVDLVIDVSDAEDPIVAIRLYRTETTDAGTAFFFVREVPFNPPQDYIYLTASNADLLLSVDLPGDTLQSLNWYPPPEDLKGLTLSTKNFYAGYVGDRLYLSEVALAYAWPEDYAIDFTGEILHIARYGDTLAVFSEREIALIVGNTPLEVRKIKVEGFEKLTSIYSTTEMDGLLYFACSSGIAVISGANAAVASEDVFTERWWKDNIDLTEVRLTAFDNALFMLSEPGGQLYRLGMGADGGGFVRLSDPDVRDVFSSSFYVGVGVLKTTESDEYIINEGEAGDRLVLWRSRMEVSDLPMAPISVRVLASDYPVELRMYNGDGTLALPDPLVINNDRIRKMPVMRREREWSFEVRAVDGTPVNIVSLEIGTSGRVR